MIRILGGWECILRSNHYICHVLQTVISPYSQKLTTGHDGQNTYCLMLYLDLNCAMWSSMQYILRVNQNHKEYKAIRIWVLCLDGLHRVHCYQGCIIWMCCSGSVYPFRTTTRVRIVTNMSKYVKQLALNQLSTGLKLWIDHIFLYLRNLLDTWFRDRQLLV